MFRLENATIRLGGRELFKNLNLQIGPTDRIGIVGPNGAGKTTLLRILGGDLELDAGQRIGPRGSTYGYLPQHGIVHEGQQLFEEARSVFAPLLALKARQEGILKSLGEMSHDHPQFEQLLQESISLEDSFTNEGGYRIDSEVGAVLKGLGFEKADWQRQTDSFSGGWQMRLALAKLLLKRPSLLLLDEPTNHLDLEARVWLAGYLKSYVHAVVLVSHDRYFLDQVIGRVEDLSIGSLQTYHGNYSYYLEERERRRAAQRAAYENQQLEIAQIEAFIERFRYKASKATQVQSRVKMLEKMERIQPPPGLRKALKFRFSECTRCGEEVIRLVGTHKSYGDTVVLNGIELTIHRGEKLALVGPNGAGKSTLVRILAGVEASDQGSRRLGHNVILNYFAQDQSQSLTPGNTVLAELAQKAPLVGEGRLRSALGSFLFSGEDVFKPVEVLSGGEKNRLALCKMLVNSGNFLLLDEPTNHLDMQAKEVLLEALRSFDGTLVFVAHDRIFLEELSTRVVSVGHGTIRSYPGSYKDYLAHIVTPQAAEGPTPGLDTSSKTSDTAEKEIDPTDKKGAYRQRIRNEREQKRRQTRIQSLEQEIEARETEVESLLEKMSDPALATSYDQLMELEGKRIEASGEIESLYAEWESLLAQESAS